MMKEHQAACPASTVATSLCLFHGLGKTPPLRHVVSTPSGRHPGARRRRA
ncbi:unnamed protein product [Trichogramma brassicae]|uniref:Uncharacterized protein n=1 Tax=Trichogramma brassicae TaxID=86971 RepID=A0A6H5HY89_9HYME|nr:unnamed protein product [Trichogramma brassicae]